LRLNAAQQGAWEQGAERSEGVQLTDEQRIDWLRLIRSPNVGPGGIMAQTAFAP
jgi:hypothetical protein